MIIIIIKDILLLQVILQGCKLYLLLNLVCIAAIVHYLDPSWRTAELKEWTENLIRDVNNPVDNDPYFAQFRNWDWFAGHSWAGGIKVNGALDGRDQESVPEVKWLRLRFSQHTNRFIIVCQFLLGF